MIKFRRYRPLLSSIRPLHKIALTGLLLASLEIASDATPVEAAIIISNLNNSSNAFDPNNGTPGDPNQNWDTSSFTVDAANYTLSDVIAQINLDPASGATDFQLQIRADSPTGPGAVLDTLAPAGAITTSIANVAFSPDTPLTLQANTTYWVSANITQGTVDWRVASDLTATGSGTLGNPAFAFSADNGATWTTVADLAPDKFQVDGVAIGAAVVPEPPALVIWCLIVAAIALSAAFRSRRAIQ